MNPYGDIVTSDETFEAVFKSIKEEELKKNQKVKKFKKIKTPDLLGMWCAAIYFSNTSRKKGTLYIGKVTRRFLTERDGFLDSVELDCLKPAYGPSSTILEEPPEHLGKDIGCFKAYDIIACCLPISCHLKHKWKYCNYPDLYSFFKMVDKVDRMEIYSSVSKQMTC